MDEKVYNDNDDNNNNRVKRAGFDDKGREVLPSQETCVPVFDNTLVLG